MTWPTRIIAQPCSRANRSSAAATSCTWPTLPGAPVRSADHSVWTESITHAWGRSCSRDGEHDLERGLCQHRHRQRMGAEPLGPQPHLRGRLLAADVQRAAARRLHSRQRSAHQRALADAGRAADQHHRAGTRPPPSTRSSSSLPVAQALQLAARPPPAPPACVAPRPCGRRPPSARPCGRPVGPPADDGLLHKRVPLPAAGAAAHPAQAGLTAGGAGEIGDGLAMASPR